MTNLFITRRKALEATARAERLEAEIAALTPKPEHPLHEDQLKARVLQALGTLPPGGWEAIEQLLARELRLEQLAAFAPHAEPLRMARATGRASMMEDFRSKLTQLRKEAMRVK